jgi:hypothetical protein
VGTPSLRLPICVWSLRMSSGTESSPTEAELPGLARHVAYELAMANLGASRLLALGQPQENGDLVWSAWVEILLLHCRVLTDFFCRLPTRDDLSALHYLPEWDRNSEDLAWLDGHVPEINKRVMHLTAYRDRQENDGRDVAETIRRLNLVMIRFLEGLPPDRREWFPIATPAPPDEGLGSPHSSRSSPCAGEG